MSSWKEKRRESRGGREERSKEYGYVRMRFPGAQLIPTMVRSLGATNSILERFLKANSFTASNETLTDEMRYWG